MTTDLHTCDSSDPSIDLTLSCLGCLEEHTQQPANPGFCCSTCGAGFDFGCRCPDY